MARFRMLRRGGVQCLLVLALMITAGFAASSASAAALSPDQLGVNISHNDMPADLAAGWPGSSGVGVARREVIEPSSWSTTDQLVTTLWNAGLRLAPVLGLPCPSSEPKCPMSWNESPGQAATDMANYVSAFAQRYGPGGSFWSGKSNPLPVLQYEIGDEPNIPIQWIEDDTHLHWSDSSPTYSGEPSAADYALVYEASQQRLASLHLPGVEAVVGGLGDSGSLDVTLTQDEDILAAITGPVDAVAFHPYTWQTDNDYAAMESDVVSLREWMNAHGMASTPIAINEFDACSSPGQGCNSTNVMTSGAWGAFVANYTTWALCTPGLGVQSVDPFTWGDTSESTNFQLLVDSSGNLTPYGTDYLNTAHTLTTVGCPSLQGISSSPGGNQGGGSSLPTARLRILHLHVHGSRVTLVIRVTYGTRSVRVIAFRGRHRIRFHVIRRRHHGTVLTLTARLWHGRWMIYLSCVPPQGYAAPHRLHRAVRIAR